MIVLNYRERFENGKLIQSFMMLERKIEIKNFQEIIKVEKTAEKPIDYYDLEIDRHIYEAILKKMAETVEQ